MAKVLFRQAVLLASLLLVTPLVAAAQTTYFPAKGVFNGFLSQQNILECENTGSSNVDFLLSVKRNDGSQLLSNYPLSISAFGSRHLILNDLFAINDSYGVFTLAIASGQEFRGDKVSCRTAFYRPAPSGRGKAFEYAYALPVENPQFGTVGGVYNSINPSPFGGPPTLNWLSIINLDEAPFSATVQIYDANGSLSRSAVVANLSPGSRQDIALGHDQGQVSGIYRIVPLDSKQLFDAFVIRYGQNLRGGFNFAFPLRSSGGACSGTPLLASTMGNGLTDNWLEIANLSDEDITVKVEIRDRDGNLRSTENPRVAKFGQHHVYLSAVIDPGRNGNIGSVAVTCSDPSDKLLVQSAFYGKLPGSPEVEWSYATQLRGKGSVTSGSQLVVPINTFVRMANWLKLADSSGGQSNIEFDVNNLFGSTVASGGSTLSAGGTDDIGPHAMVGQNFIGTMVSQSLSSSAAFTGEILRVLPNDNGQIGTIMQIPGIIQQKGLGGVTEVGFLGNPQSLAPYRDKLTAEEARHLFTRAAFGHTASEVSYAQTNGLKAAVSKLTTFVDSSAVDSIAMAYPYLDGNNTLSGIQHSNVSVRRFWLYEMLHTPNPLREKMALIWHDLFATSCRVVGEEHDGCFNYLNKLRQHSLGSFRTLMKSMNSDWLMLYWLNGRLNNKAVPDENYAREHWELFSMGEKTKHKGRYALYTEQDIAEAARAFTGCWVVPSGSITSAECPTADTMEKPGRNFVAKHDNNVKTLWRNTPYEVSGNFYPDDITDLTLDRRPEAAQFLAKRLFTAFVHDHPSDDLVNQIAALLRMNNFEIKPVVTAILRSEAMYSSEARDNRVKDPVTFMVGLLRTTGIPTDNLYLQFRIRESGLVLVDPPDVSGWPLTKPGSDKKSMYFLGWPSVYSNFVQQAIQVLDPGATAVQSLRNLLPVANSTAEQVVDHLSALLDVQLTSEERADYIFYMKNQRNADGTFTEKGFHTASGSNGDGFVRTKVAGLLWILTQHESFLMY